MQCKSAQCRKEEEILSVWYCIHHSAQRTPQTRLREILIAATIVIDIINTLHELLGLTSDFKSDGREGASPFAEGVAGLAGAIGNAFTLVGHVEEALSAVCEFVDDGFGVGAQVCVARCGDCVFRAVDHFAHDFCDGVDLWAEGVDAGFAADGGDE